jgi:hypothetical protein
MHEVQPREYFWRSLVKTGGQVRPTRDCVAVLEGRNELPSWGGVSVQLPVPKAPVFSWSAKKLIGGARRGRVRLE